MKEAFERFYKKAIKVFIETEKREPNEDEIKALRQAAQITTAMYLIATNA